MLITVHCSYSQDILYQQNDFTMPFRSKEYKPNNILGRNVGHMDILRGERNSIKRNHSQPVGTLNAFIDLLNSCCTEWQASSCESYYCSSIPGQVNVLGGLTCQTSTAETSTLLLALQQEQQTHQTSANKTGNHGYQRGLSIFYLCLFMYIACLFVVYYCVECASRKFTIRTNTGRLSCTCSQFQILSTARNLSHNDLLLYCVVLIILYFITLANAAFVLQVAIQKFADQDI